MKQKIITLKFSRKMSYNGPLENLSKFKEYLSKNLVNNYSVANKKRLERHTNILKDLINGKTVDSTVEKLRERGISEETVESDMRVICYSLKSELWETSEGIR